MRQRRRSLLTVALFAGLACLATYVIALVTVTTTPWMG